jgi:hypothetical protein
MNEFKDILNYFELHKNNKYTEELRNESKIQIDNKQRKFLEIELNKIELHKNNS